MKISSGFCKESGQIGEREIDKQGVQHRVASHKVDRPSQHIPALRRRLKEFSLATIVSFETGA